MKKQDLRRCEFGVGGSLEEERYYRREGLFHGFLMDSSLGKCWALIETDDGLIIHFCMDSDYFRFLD